MPTLPTGWAAMPSLATHAADILSYPIGWGWSGAPLSGLGLGNGVFGFMVYTNIAGAQNLSIDENGNFNAKVRYRVIVTNPSTITNATLPRLAIELRCLSYASSPLPNIGSPLFGGLFGTATGASGMTYPKVRAIQFEQESDKDPSIWSIIYTVARPPNGSTLTRPSTGSAPTKPNIEEAPWTIGPAVQVSFGTEDFVLGLGRFVGTKTPAELDAKLTDGTYAAEFNTTAAATIIMNSGLDPLESPPPMKVGTATISISRAFAELPSSITADLNAAVEEVCTAAVTANGVTFKAFTCKLNGGTITNKRWKKQCDWLPKQLHPLGLTWAEVGWTPPTSATSTIAYNYTRNTIPAFEYVEYYEVSVSVAQRDLGWGYALVDKGYNKIVNGQQKEIRPVDSRQSQCKILAEGSVADLSAGAANLKVLRLYQVLKTGTHLSAVLDTMLE